MIVAPQNIRCNVFIVLQRICCRIQQIHGAVLLGCISTIPTAVRFSKPEVRFSLFFFRCVPLLQIQRHESLGQTSGDALREERTLGAQAASKRRVFHFFCDNFHFELGHRILLFIFCCLFQCSAIRPIGMRIYLTRKDDSLPSNFISFPSAQPFYVDDFLEFFGLRFVSNIDSSIHEDNPSAGKSVDEFYQPIPVEKGFRLKDASKGYIVVVNDDHRYGFCSTHGTRGIRNDYSVMSTRRTGT
mmetsp:Transcript_26122/g.61353  ORF Transcript_26122/g.61353 Transcript_26122/m.61353 type:complete len:243 (+) Transcript_26122:2199-2927(+)